MLIAQEKRKQNITEYILYMYQVEDTIRACDFNMDMLENRVISQFQVPETVKMEIRDWYSNILLMMHEEGVKKSGHISLLTSLVDDLNKLHLKLLNEIRDQKYLEQYAIAHANIRDFESKLGSEVKTEIDTCLTALYVLLLLRLQKKDISQETREAMQTFSNMMALLGVWFKKVEEGKLAL